MNQRQAQAESSTTVYEETKERLMKDEYAKDIAEALGVELEDYVEQVLFFALNPEIDPQMTLIAEDELEGIGIDTEIVDREVREWLESTFARLGHLLDDAADSVDLDGSPRRPFGTEVSNSAPSVESARGNIVVDDANQAAVKLKQQLVLQKLNNNHLKRRAKVVAESGARE